MVHPKFLNSIRCRLTRVSVKAGVLGDDSCQSKEGIRLALLSTNKDSGLGETVQSQVCKIISGSTLVICKVENIAKTFVNH